VVITGGMFYIIVPYRFPMFDQKFVMMY